MALYNLSGNSQVVSTSGKNTLVNVLVTATALVAANPSRNALTLQNLGNKTVYVGFDNTVSESNYAIAINPSLAYEFSIPFKGALWAISSAATQSINVVELS